MGYVPLSNEHIPNRGIEEWASILVDYVYQLVGDEEALEPLVSTVLGSGALAALTLSAEDAYLQVLTDATDTACNYLLLRDESDRLPSLPYHYAITGTPVKMAQDSIWRAARKLPVLKRAALALSDLLNLETGQVARVLRQPPEHTERFVEEARREYGQHLEEITHLRGQFPLANIAPAIALGLRPRYGYAKSAYALLPSFELPDERLAILKWNAVQHQVEEDDEDDEDEPSAALLAAEAAPLPAALPLQPVLFFFALVALLIGGLMLGSNATRGPESSSQAMVVSAPTPTTSAGAGVPLATSVAGANRAGEPTATATPVLVATATATASASATATADETEEPDFALSPTGTSTPRIVRRTVPRATSTPTRVYAPAPTRTPTRVPTRTPRPPTATATTLPPPMAPTSTPVAFPSATFAPPSATPLQSPTATATGAPPTATATNPPPTPTKTATTVPPTATNAPPTATATNPPPTPTRTPTPVPPTPTPLLPTATPVP